MPLPLSFAPGTIGMSRCARTITRSSGRLVPGRMPATLSDTHGATTVRRSKRANGLPDASADISRSALVAEIATAGTLGSANGLLRSAPPNSIVIR